MFVFLGAHVGVFFFLYLFFNKIYSYQESKGMSLLFVPGARLVGGITKYIY